MAMLTQDGAPIVDPEADPSDHLRRLDDPTAMLNGVAASWDYEIMLGLMAAIKSWLMQSGNFPVKLSEQ